MRMNRGLSWLVAIVLCSLCQSALAATTWSAQDYDLYSGDFDGDGQTDVLYIAKDPRNLSGIARALNGGFDTSFQSWPSNFLGLPWAGNPYTVVVLQNTSATNKRASILLQSKVGGAFSYLLQPNSEGRITGISQPISNAGGLTWSADQHRIVAGDFNADGIADVFLQSTTSSGTNAIMAADANGQFSAGAPLQQWSDGFLGFKWATSEALVYAGQFDGQYGTDLLIQARPRFVPINYDVQFPVPTYPPNMNGVAFAHSSGNVFQAAAVPGQALGYYAWSRNTFGVDWSSLVNNILVGNFNGSSRQDVLIQSRSSNRNSYLLTANGSATVFGTGTALASNVAWSSDAVRLIPGGYSGGATTGMYFQALNVSGTNTVATTITGGSVSTTTHDPSSPPPLTTPVAAGRTPTSFAVTSSGSAAYTIPLWAPPGVGEVQLKLALAYNSRGFNGVMGMGWGLSGLSAITRCGRTWAQDGVAQPIGLNFNDRFCLDGQELKLVSGSAGQGGSVYATEIESFSKIAATGAAGSAPVSFMVTTANGLIYDYGLTADAKIMAGPSAPVRTWALSQIRDRIGNAIKFSYYNDAMPGSGYTAGTYRIKQIDYPYTASGQGPFYRVQFAYVARTANDIPRGYFAGFESIELNLLSTITVQAQNSGSWATTKAYNLAYQANPVTSRTRLLTVTECSTSSCFPPTSITYQNGVRGWSSTATSVGVNAFLPISVDLNGDGRTDVLYTTSTAAGSKHWWAVLATATGYSGAIDTHIDATQLIVGNFAGKGQPQILAAQSGTWFVYNYDGTNFVGSGSTGLTVNGEYLGIDYDGDGLLDLVSKVGANLVVRRNTTMVGGAVAFAATTQVIWNTAGTYSPDRMFAAGLLSTADFNSDGRADLLISTVEQDPQTGQPAVTWYALTSNGFGSAATALRLFRSLSPRTLDVGDLNGDGCTDIFGIGVVYISNCAGAFTTKVVSSSGGIVIPTDWDGDGLTDLLDNNNGTWYVLRSKGNDFEPSVSTGIAAPTTTSWFSLDQNGDGLPDLAYVDGNNSNALKFQLHSGAGTLPDLATSFTDGFGMSQSPTYVSIAQNNYTKCSGTPCPAPTFPEADYQGPLYVVDQFTASDGTGSTYQNQFWYYGARTHLQGRGFEGFYAQRSYDPRTTLYTYAYSSQAFPYTGLAVQKLVSTSGTNVGLGTTAGHVSLRTATPAAQTMAGLGGFEQRYFPFIQSATTSRYEYGALSGAKISTTVQSYTYGDGFGNLTQTQTQVTDNDPTSPFVGLTWQTTVTNSFLNDTSAWCLGLPTDATMQSSAPGQTTKQRTYQFVPDTNHAYCREQKRIVEPATTALMTTETFGYDTCGNVNSIAVLGHEPDGTLKPVRTTSYNYSYFTSRCQLPEAATNALGQMSTTSYQYDFGMPLQAKDPNGFAVNFLYDDFGRKIRETGPDSTFSTWQFKYCVNAPCWGVADLRFLATQNDFDSNGASYRTQSAFYDGFLRLRYDASNRVFGTWTVNEARTYDSLGRVRTRNVPYSFSGNGYWQYNYDVLSRRTSATLYQQSGAADRTYTWSYAGRSVGINDPLSHVTTHIGDVTGKLRRVIDPTPGGTTQYEYDVFGNLNKITDPIGKISTASYNLLGFKTDSTDADSGTWHFDGNSLNELVAWRDAKTQLFSADYDLLGRIAHRTEPEGTSTWTWGASAPEYNIGSLKSVSGYGYLEELTYDSVGRPQTRKITTDQAYQYDYTYNTIGGVDTLTYPVSPAPSGTTATRFKIQYAYSFGVPYQILDVTQPTASPLWTLSAANDSSLPTTQSLGANAIVVSATYTPWTNELTSLQSGVPSAPSNRQNLSYQWDTAGNLHSRQDLIQSLTEVFTYDALNRLRSSTLNGVQNFAADYDAAGDIRSRSDVNNSSLYVYADAAHPHAATTAGSYTFAHDANGNVTSRNGLTLSWSSFNMPTALQATVGGGTYSSQFLYGPDHQRYQQSATYSNGTENTSYVGGLLEKVSGSNTGGITSWRHYVPTPSGLTVIVARNSDASTATTYPLSDHLGSSDAVVDSAGNLAVQQSFGAFGQRRASNWTAGAPTTAQWSAIARTTRRGFTFHEGLDNIGLVHMNGRVYDPNVGRFLSADPVIDDFTDSQSINAYAYVSNRPLSMVDPTGFDADLATVVVTGTPATPVVVVVAAVAVVGKAITHFFHSLLGGGSQPPPPPAANAIAGNSAQSGLQGGGCGAGAASGACGGVTPDSGALIDEVVVLGTTPTGEEILLGAIPGMPQRWLDFPSTVEGPAASPEDPGLMQVTVSAPRSIFVSLHTLESALAQADKEIILGVWGGVERKVFTTVASRMASNAAKAGARSYAERVKAAQKEFPGKAGKLENHHITPKYLGGPQRGPTVPVDGAYHQQITNEFRRLSPYGKGIPNQQELEEIMKKVYEKYPLLGM